MEAAKLDILKQKKRIKIWNNRKNFRDFMERNPHVYKTMTTCDLCCKVMKTNSFRTHHKSYFHRRLKELMTDNEELLIETMVADDNYSVSSEITDISELSSMTEINLRELELIEEEHRDTPSTPINTDMPYIGCGGPPPNFRLWGC